jgi:excisionase family DNA binding protein
MMREMADKWFTTAEVAEKLQLNPVTVHRWIRQGKLAAMGVGGSAGYRIRGEDIEHLLYTDYGTLEAHFRRVAATNYQAVDAVRQYAEGLTGQTKQRTVKLLLKMEQDARDALQLAESFSDVKGVYRPRQVPLAENDHQAKTKSPKVGPSIDS